MESYSRLSCCEGSGAATTAKLRSREGTAKKAKEGKAGAGGIGEEQREGEGLRFRATRGMRRARADGRRRN